MRRPEFARATVSPHSHAQPTIRAGLPGDDGVRRNVAGHDRARAHDGEAPDTDRRDERGVRADGRALLDARAIPARSAGVGRARVAHVGELRPGADEHVFAEHDAVPDARVALDPRPEPTTAPRATKQNAPDDDIVAELRAIGDHRRRRKRGAVAGARASLHAAGHASVAGPCRASLSLGPRPLTYKQAGVDIDAGDELVERIKPLAAATRIAEVIGGVGGFAGLCSVPADVEDPVLVSGTDGVGTKLKVAFATGVHDTIGFDLVGMCVNDIVTCGARPLFSSTTSPRASSTSRSPRRWSRGSLRRARRAAARSSAARPPSCPGCTPRASMISPGFAVGVVARAKIVDGARVAEGDVAIALPSSGLHSNGYSLARRLCSSDGPRLDARPPELGAQSAGEALLTPTRLYPRAVQACSPPGSTCAR